MSVYSTINMFYLFYIIIAILIVLYLILRLTLGICKSNACLVGKTAIVTGGNGGIGFRVALALAGRGCKVIIADVTDGEKSIKQIIEWTENPNVSYKYINLASFNSVRKFAEDINKNEERLHILINNAGCGLFSATKTDDGCNLGMQVNHFGGFLLTHLLIDLLKKSAPSRIVFTSSWFSFFNNLTEENLNKPKINYIYHNSKVCNIISSDGFAKKLKGTGVTSYSVHPGAVNTNIFAKLDNENHNKFLTNFIMYKVILPIFAKSADEGAQTVINCAISKKLEKETGHFYADCMHSLRPQITKNVEFCDKIWKLSETFAQLKDNEKL